MLEHERKDSIGKFRGLMASRLSFIIVSNLVPHFEGANSKEYKPVMCNLDILLKYF